MNRSGIRSPGLLVGLLGLFALVRCGGTSSPPKTTTEGLVIDAGECPPNDKGELHRCQSPTCSVSGVGQDECLTDSDCPSGTACSCAGDFAANVGFRNRCIQANCRTDADCGSGGVCSPLIHPGPCGYVNGFFCRTPQDTCATDADCSLEVSGTSCEYNFPQLSNANRDGGVQTPGYWTCQEPGQCPSRPPG